MGQSDRCGKCGKPTRSHPMNDGGHYCHTCWEAATEPERDAWQKEANTNRAETAAALALLAALPPEKRIPFRTFFS